MLVRRHRGGGEIRRAGGNGQGETAKEETARHFLGGRRKIQERRQGRGAVGVASGTTLHQVWLPTCTALMR